MNGDPVWLASISKTSLLTGDFAYVPEWSPETFATAERLLLDALAGAGNPARERLFRMNVTLCLHRALSTAEVAALPPRFYADGGSGLAGGPVAILRETERGGNSTLPCEAPLRQRLPGSRSVAYGWLPRDCGSCEPCRARARLE
jgi:hypothetical protein